MASETDLQTLKIVNTQRFWISISGYQGISGSEYQDKLFAGFQERFKIPYQSDILVIRSPACPEASGLIC